MHVDSATLLKLDKPLPRYTSYPTAPCWGRFDVTDYKRRLEECGEGPLSLYVHIPFCATMCLFCGCSVILNRKEEVEEAYVDTLCQEIALLKGALRSKKSLSQLHFGGGTPTKLSIPLLEKVLRALHEAFSFTKEAEIAIEIDPRTVVLDKGEKLFFLRKWGFNRVSFGIQDTSEKVQEAIRRRQSKEVSCAAFALARQASFEEISCDLIYGLPYQTFTSFQETIAAILEMRPDRIALFSYAKIPALKPHQRAIAEETLPSTQEKFAIYAHARSSFITAGYLPIGMDHFALPHSELAQSYSQKSLARTFQGYTVKCAETLLGIGVTSIGILEGAYVQNAKELTDYTQRVKSGSLPIFRGKILSDEDRIRKFVIDSLMCRFHIDKNAFQMHFGIDFDTHFAYERKRLEEYGQLALETRDKIVVTPLGELFIRTIASLFDAYLPTQQPAFSKAI